MAPIAEAYVRVRPDVDNFHRDLHGRLRDQNGRFIASGRGLGRTLSDGFSEGFQSQLPAAGNRWSSALHRGFGRTAKTAMKTIGYGAIGAFGAAVAAGFAGIHFGRQFVEEAREAGRVTRITENAIRATGGAARVTSKDVQELSDAISLKTAIDDEQIQTAANMILTFKNVRNEVGAGNDIFNRAVQAGTDLSVQFGDITITSKMLAKALNDPIAGINAMARAGVTFTQQQKDQIKTLVESGRTLEAQGMILDEVESQVGGAAQAAADPLQRLSVVSSNLKETVGIALLPVLDKFSTWLADRAPAAGDKIAGWLTRTGIPAFEDFAGGIAGAFGWIREEALPALGDLKDFVVAEVLPRLGELADFVQEDLAPAFEEFATDVLPGVAGLLDDLATSLDNLSEAFGGNQSSMETWGESGTSTFGNLGAVARAELFNVGLNLKVLTKAFELSTANIRFWAEHSIGFIKGFVDAFFDMVTGILRGGAKVADVLGMDWLAGKMRGAADSIDRFADNTEQRLEDTQRYLDGVNTTKAKEEFRSLAEIANRSLNSIQDEDVSVQYKLFAQRFGGKPLPISGGAGPSSAFARHVWRDPEGIGGPTVNVREAWSGHSSVNRAMRRAYRQVAASGTYAGKPVWPYTISATFGSYPGHTGIDLAGPAGSAIHAMGGGEVARALALTTSYGKHVIIDHPDGWSTLYAHMDTLGVRSGQGVGGGQIIGTRGSTGRSTGNHLHFEVRRWGRAIDPQSVMSFDTGFGVLRPGWNLAYNGTGGDEPLGRGGAIKDPSPGPAPGRDDLRIVINGKRYEIDLKDLTKTARKAANETMTFADKLVAALEKQIDKSTRKFAKKIEAERKTWAAAIASTEKEQAAAYAAESKAQDALVEQTRDTWQRRADDARTYWDAVLKDALRVASEARKAFEDLKASGEAARAAASGAVMGVIDVGAMAQDPVGHLRTWANDARRFVEGIKGMVAKGLPAALIQQVIAMGPTAGWDVVQAFNSLDVAGVGDVTAAYAEIGAYATQAGQIAMNLAAPPELLERLDAQAAAAEMYAEQTRVNGENAVAAIIAQGAAAVEAQRAASDAALAALAEQHAAVIANMQEQEAKAIARLEAQQEREVNRLQRAIDALGEERIAVLERHAGEVIFRIVQDEERRAARRR